MIYAQPPGSLIAALRAALHIPPEVGLVTVLVDEEALDLAEQCDRAAASLEGEPRG